MFVKNILQSKFKRQCLNLWRTSFEDTLPDEELPAHPAVLFVEKHRGVIGMATLEQNRRVLSQNNTLVHKLCVKESKRGCGVGKAIIKSVEQKESQSIGVFVEDTKLLDFYAKIGFIVPNTRRKLGKNKHFLVMKESRFQ